VTSTSTTTIPVNRTSAASSGTVRTANRFARKSRFRWLIPTVYIVFLMLPIYWLINMSFKNNQEILSTFTLFPPTRHCEITR